MSDIRIDDTWSQLAPDPISDDERAAAARMVARLAKDTSDEGRLLAALGLNVSEVAA